MSSIAPSSVSSRKPSKSEFERAIDAEIRRRVDLLVRCMSSESAARIERERCARSTKYFINNWVWTFDPREERKRYPMLLWDIQASYIDWLDERFVLQEPGLCEKSRDMGATWLNCAHAVHKFCFLPGFSALFGSINGDKVDDGTINSIFGKLEYILDSLPGFLCPRLKAGHHITKMRIVNPRNGSLLLGETMNDNFGRSGRVSILHVDEAAHIPRSEKISAAVSFTSRCVIWTSSPQGKGNEFARIRFETKVKRFTMSWRDHPLRTEEWYQQQLDLLAEHVVASELDLSYERSKVGRIYKVFRRPYHTPDVEFAYNPAFRQYCCWDFGYGGAMAVLFVQVTPEGEIQVWCYLEVKERDIDFCLPITEGRKPMGYELLGGEEKKHVDWVLSKVPRGFKPHEDVGDHAGTQRTANSGRSCRDAIDARPGRTFVSTPKNTYDWRIKCTRRMLGLRRRTDGTYYAKFLVSKDCARVIDCFFNYEQDGSNALIVKPKINEFSHLVTAGEYLAINKYPVEEDQGASGYKARSRR